MLAGGMRDFDGGAFFAGEELKCERNFAAGKDSGVGQARFGRFLQLIVLPLIEFQGPRLPIHDQNFMYADLIIKGDFFMRAVAGAGDLDEKIGRTAPVGIAIFRLRAYPKT